ncbi:DUF2989 domain-containing protein [Catenovulum sp. 2E275]|uniref:DUF2989 domain-containing protein n=1 Tax=Catenovulum sp. 2E275 TaxID=2980497 RepID=UPI0021CEEDC8|nr:DUF2989 domain-containing protein [Catenovulum sp. 2E275]MCU4674448.1 DUF2989 domain-containing protein [Catenovulum sp. 2E275]
MKLNKWTFPLAVSFLSLAALTACDSGPTLRQVCEQNQQFCDDLNQDAWCKAERKEVIFGRYNEQQNPTDQIRYKLMLDLESYSTCVEKASHIEHIKLRDKQTGRVKGYITSLKELKRLSDVTKNSTDPYLLYWHWSRNGDETAMQKFLNLRDSGILQTPDLQLKLATYYVKFDRDLTIDTLYHALEIYDGTQVLKPEIFKTLSTLFIKEEKYKHAYVWGKIAKEHGIIDIDLAPLKAILQNEGNNIASLDQLVTQYSEQIKNGQFIAPNR